MLDKTFIKNDTKTVKISWSNLPFGFPGLVLDECNERLDDHAHDGYREQPVVLVSGEGRRQPHHQEAVDDEHASNCQCKYRVEKKHCWWRGSELNVNVKSVITLV